MDFFRTLFGMEPAKLRPDYAKFESDDPPLVLSLEPKPPTGRRAAQPPRVPGCPDARS
ncbi:MAG: hypothetical protein U0871_11075 [Gemmataceae bacterium]